MLHQAKEEQGNLVLRIFYLHFTAVSTVHLVDQAVSLFRRQHALWVFSPQTLAIKLIMKKQKQAEGLVNI